VLQQGGNAIDAAVTAAAVLSVVEPHMNGIGGDLFAIVYSAKTKRVHVLNASGRSAQAATIEEFQRRGLKSIPYRGELSVSVPGVVDGWHELLANHGTRTMAQALEPAIRYAREGYAVSEIIAAAGAARPRRCRRTRRPRRHSSSMAAPRTPARSSATRTSPTASS
jgi:gamma-glutamyltranspeptidase / glutathione hydrolase